MIRNVSSRTLLVRIRNTGAGGLEIVPKPRWVRLKPGGHAPVTLNARLKGAPPEGGSAEGALLLVARGAGPLKIPWAITFGPQRRDLISAVALSTDSFKPSDPTPAVLSFLAGSLREGAAGPQIQPVARLDIELWRGGERLGLLARLRDLLPGRIRVRHHRPRPERHPARPGPLSDPARGDTDQCRAADHRTIAFTIK